MVNFIEFPIFDGVSGDLRAWISWLEDFFVRERFTEDEKMNLAQSLLEGEANAWFYSSRKRFAFQSWEHLVVELLLWRFGAFGDGGVFSDLELFLLWNKYDRILRKRRKRMETTSITPQESISSPATIHETVPIDKFFNQQVDEISGEKKDESHESTLVTVLDNLEEASVTQNQVSVSKLEPSLQIPKDSPNVCENSQAVVGCEHQRSFQKNIRMDVVNGVVERSQRVMSITKNVSAHQVLDKTSAHKERLKPKSKRKLSLSLKTWKFKFKNKMLQRNRSQMDLHQVIDISKVTNSYPCFSVSFGLVRKKRTVQCLQLKKQAHNSRFLYQLRMLHDPGGKKDEHSDDIFDTEVDRDNVQRTQMDIVAESVITAPDNVVSSFTDVALSTDVISIRQTMQLEGWDEACDAAIDALEGTGTCIVTSLPARCGWLVFDRGKKGQLQWPEIQTISWYKEMVADPVKQAVINLVPNAARFGFLSVLSQTHAVHLDVKQDFMRNQALPQSHRFKVDKFGRLNNTRVTVVRVLCLLGTLFGSTSVKKQKFGKNWWYKFKHSLWQRECGRELLVSEAVLAVRFDVIGRRELLLQWQNRDESEHSWMLAVEVVVAETVVDVSFDDVGRSELLIKWQHHDASEYLWMFSKAFVHLYPSYKLEDKLGLEGVSIDTIHHRNIGRRSRPDIKS